LRKFNFKIQQKRSFLFFPLYFLIREREKKKREKGTTVFVVEKLIFQIEFSQKKGSIEKISKFVFGIKSIKVSLFFKNSHIEKEERICSDLLQKTLWNEIMAQSFKIKIETIKSPPPPLNGTIFSKKVVYKNTNI
jgi:hypothetical protein